MRRGTARMGAIAPPAPPCFPDRVTWLEYLDVAATTNKSTRQFRVVPVVLVSADGQERFNHEYNFCHDCNAQHSFRMANEGRCDPGYLKRLESASA